MPSKDELICHIQILNSLIDGDHDDELGQHLTPVVAMLEKMVTTILAKENESLKAEVVALRGDIERLRKHLPY